MPLGYAPTVFVSSTCYDLNHLRADLKPFLENMGLDPILSETPAFPVSPETSPVENCLRAVRERADVFVLIIGARYGSRGESGKSVTNLEFLEAKAKGIPIYVFVDKGVLAVLPVWKKNPGANYEGSVDTPELFTFVEGLQGSQGHWVFAFQDAQGIKDTLRNQLAYLFMEGLVLRKKVQDLQLPPSLSNLSGRSLKLVLERPFGWEYRLFSCVLSEEMKSDQELQWDLKYGFAPGRIYSAREPLVMVDWLQGKLRHAIALVGCASRFVDRSIEDAVGDPGLAGDPERLVYCARRVAQLRKEFMKWTIEFRCTEVRPECERLLFLASEMAKGVIATLESLPAKVDDEITKGEEARARGEKYKGAIMLRLTIPCSDELDAEIAKLGALLQYNQPCP